MRGQRSIDRLLQLRILHQFKASSDAGPANASQRQRSQARR